MPNKEVEKIIKEVEEELKNNKDLNLCMKGGYFGCACTLCLAEIKINLLKYSYAK